MASSYIEFVKAALKNPMQISTVFQTSRWLRNRLLHRINLKDAKFVIELGPGAGAITEYLTDHLPKGTRYIGIELNPDLIRFLRKTYPHFEFIEASAEECAALSEKHGPVDVVISSLPWTIFPSEVQKKILLSVHQALKPGGQFVTYVCLNASLYPAAQNLKDLLHGIFKNVHKSEVEWRNIPPAFVYTCTK